MNYPMNVFLKYTFIMLLLLAVAPINVQAGNTDTTVFNANISYSLIKRVLPDYADHFIVEYIAKENNKDAFELESKGDKIILRGNNGVSVASAFNYWLTNYAHCNVSWNGVNLAVPKLFPMVPGKIHKVTPHDYRHYFNYCTFNYTSSWWDWDRWQWEIDFMALNGINMPLAMTGQNALWDRVYRKLGFGDKDMDAFFTGPAYFMWFWAGNIDGLNGPLPQSWMKSHEDLEKKILNRERELGMTPILPAFSGHVPPTFKDKFPNAKVDKVSWEGRFADAYVLDPDDPMFQKIGDMFMQEQDKAFGNTDHLYGADTFNEMFLPHEDTAYVRKIGRAVYRGMAKTDPKAVWILQGWTFWDKRDFWKPERVKNYLSDVPNDKLIILDLFADQQPIWNKTDAFYGKKWIWCMLHNFGGKNVMFGNMDYLAKEPAEMVHDNNKVNMAGIGLTPEGIEQNPVIYSLMLHHVWDDQPINVPEWLNNYAYSRYGRKDPHTEKAWQVLHKTVYSQEGSYEAIISARPTFRKNNDWASTDLDYNPAELIKAWDELIIPADALKNNDCYQYDLVSVGRQVMANYSKVLQQQFAADFKKHDHTAFKKHTLAYLQLIDDIDALMATRKDFLLGKWLNDAKACGNNAYEKKLYEENARDLITLWGGKDASLHDYGTKQWSGLFKGFYKKRWELFINAANLSLNTGKKFNHDAVDEKIKAWEWKWVNSNETYPDKTQGDPVTVSRAMYKKYAALMAKQYADNPQFTKN